MNKLILLLMLIVSLHSLPANAQLTETRDRETEIILDELLAQQDLDLNYEELYESVLLRLTSPININKASAEELRSLFILREQQVQDLISHRATNGELLSHHELQSIPSFNVELIRRLLPLITVEPSGISPSRLLKRIFTERNNYLVTRYERLIEPKAGFSQAIDSLNRFRGSPDKWFMRFRVSHPGDFSLGFTMEKDPGELSIADYFSFHAQVANKRRLTNFIIGDFQAQFGQGLVLGGGFGMGKGSETITSVRRNTLGFLPYTSVRESGFFRGAAASLSLTRDLTVHAFGSMVKPDATVDASAEETYIQSFQTSGLHRNVKELTNRKASDETSYGAVIEYNRRAFQTGATFLRTIWDAPVRTSPAVYNQFDFSGRHCTNAGVFLNYTIANFTLFSEGAQTLGRGFGIVGGILGSLTKEFDISFLARTYARDFQSIQGNALAESSTPQNEAGLYWGWKYQASKAVTLSGYADLFRFPWMRYRMYSPSSVGHELLIRLMWKPSKSASIFLQAREEQKARNVSPGTTVYKTASAIRRNYCINADYTVGRIDFKTRLQLSALDALGKTQGVALAQEVGYELRNWGFQLRHVIFDTDDFDNRQYMYEPDMWLAYSFPAYDGTGIRSIVMVRRRLGSRADVWVRWSRAVLYSAEMSGSGVDQVNGPARNDLKVQLRVRF